MIKRAPNHTWQMPSGLLASGLMPTGQKLTGKSKTGDRIRARLSEGNSAMLRG